MLSKLVPFSERLVSDSVFMIVVVVDNGVVVAILVLTVVVPDVKSSVVLIGNVELEVSSISLLWTY